MASLSLSFLNNYRIHKYTSEIWFILNVYCELDFKQNATLTKDFLQQKIGLKHVHKKFSVLWKICYLH